jgi:hypothetical protein
MLACELAAVVRSVVRRAVVGHAVFPLKILIAFLI